VSTGDGDQQLANGAVLDGSVRGGGVVQLEVVKR
jgi:hypothetical protein